MPKLQDLVRGLGLANAGGLEAEITGLSCDSRSVRPGDLFFAMPGARTDGNRFAKAALERGARAVVSELDAPPPPVSLSGTWLRVADAALAMGLIADQFFAHPSGALTVFGVTGTNGKTTTSYFLESILKACGRAPAVIGTVDYRFGSVSEKAPNTTPISLDLLRLLARFRDAGATDLCMEVSSHALALKRVDEVDFDVAIFTNITRDHLDFHKTPEAYFEAKARLFELLVKTSSSKKRRVAAINADDPKEPALRRRASGADVIAYGLGAKAALRAENLRPGVAGCQFELSWQGRRLQASIALAGEHNVLNALAAAAAALGLGLSEKSILEGLANLKQVPGRLERVDAGQNFSVFVDFAHTDSALKTVLSYLAKLPHKRLITVFGCGGDRDKTKRGPMGVAACQESDLAVVTSDNPRTEDPLAIIADIEQGISAAGLKNYKAEPDRRKAILLAVSQAKEGDIVVIAGKGHETCQLVGTVSLPFDDRVEARAALKLVA